jgi:hypothetical protein
MSDEIASLLQHNVFEHVELPEGCKAIKARWLFDYKFDEFGNIVRHKARFVAKGYEQEEGKDFTNVFAPTATRDTERAFLAYVAAHDLELHQLDVKTAFLHGELAETTYVEQPEGFHQGGPRTVWLLKKALYGLRQAPRAWYLHLRKILEELGFTASQADASFFTFERAGDRIMLLVYVDDMLAAAKLLTNVTDCKRMLQDKFDIKDLGQAKIFLGMEIERNREQRILKLSQRSFVSNLASRFDATDTVPCAIPMSPEFELFPKDAGPPIPRSDFPYQSLVGGLLYASTGTRPDIAHAVALLARVNHCYTQAHVDALLRVLRYTYHTRDLGLVFGTSADALLGYCDASYASDTAQRTSTSGYLYLSYGAAISWHSRKQDIVAQSTQEAEYIAASAAGKQGLWLRTLGSDFVGHVVPVVINTDNTAALTLLSNGIASKRSKHIDVQYHFARNRVMRGELSYKYCSTEQMWADGLTKALPRVKFEACRDAMGLR